MIYPFIHLFYSFISIFSMGDRFQFLARCVSHVEEEENRAPQPLIQRLACPVSREKNIAHQIRDSRVENLIYFRWQASPTLLKSIESIVFNIFNVKATFSIVLDVQPVTPKIPGWQNAQNMVCSVQFPNISMD